MKKRLLKRKLSLTGLAKRLGTCFSEKRLTLALAESCTGGMIGSAITSISGSSAYFKGGIIAYSNEIKRRALGVPQSVLDKKGAVSIDTVRLMAVAAQKCFGADCGIAVSGIAGPGGGTKKKPVGLVYVGICAGEKVKVFRYLFKGGRASVRRQAAYEALQRMLETIAA